MCRRVQCSKCGRPTYAGCGAHIEQVLRDVPPAERCRCREEPVQDVQAHESGTKGWFRSLFGK